MSGQDLDEHQIAAYLHLTPQQVRRLADRGQLPARRVAGSWRFSEAEIHVWLEDRIGASTLEELSRVQQMHERKYGLVFKLFRAAGRIVRRGKDYVGIEITVP